MILGIDVGQKNLGVCVWDPGSDRIQLWDIWTTEGTWAPEVFACLRDKSLPEGITKVVIEHQPSKNPTMVRIMHYLEFWFVTQGYSVSLQDSKHKLLYASTLEHFPKDSTDAAWTYHHRKKLAVQTVSAFVEATEQPLGHVFLESKKKDDLADALLHAMAFTCFGKVIHAPPPSASSKPAKVVARAPTEKQLRTGRLSQSNVKYLLRDTPTEGIADALKSDKRLGRALKKHFGSVDGFVSRTR